MPVTKLIMCSFVILLFAGAIQATEHDDESNYLEKRYYFLKGLRETYSEEIFDYCVDEVGFEYSWHTKDSQLILCLSRQKRLQKGNFNRAIEQLGRKSLALPIYTECLDYYPTSSMSLIGKCMDLRLELRERIDEPSIESEIFARCHGIWRKHGIRAIRNCAINDANHYLQNGELRD